MNLVKDGHRNSTKDSMTVEIAAYNDIIEAIVDPEVMIIDVREPDEIASSGSIPTSINIPSKFPF